MSEWSSEKITSTGFDARLKGERGFEIHFYTNKREAYLAVEKVCRQFIDNKTQTNADRIRSMTDDELASVLLDERCSFCDANNYSVCNSTKRCHEEIEAWLRAEVKDG